MPANPLLPGMLPCWQRLNACLPVTTRSCFPAPCTELVTEDTTCLPRRCGTSCNLQARTALQAAVLEVCSQALQLQLGHHSLVSCNVCLPLEHEHKMVTCEWTMAYSDIISCQLSCFAQLTWISKSSSCACSAVPSAPWSAFWTTLRGFLFFPDFCSWCKKSALVYQISFQSPVPGTAIC